VWEMTEDDGGVRRLTTNALEQAPDSVADVSLLDVAVSTRSTLTAAQALAQAEAALVSTDAAIALIQTDTAAILLDTDELQGDWEDGGRLDLILDSRATLGAGALTITYTLTSDEDDSPVAGADVWITTDVAGDNVIASGTTSDLGAVNFFLDPGTYFVWRSHSDFDFAVNPETKVAS